MHHTHHTNTKGQVTEGQTEHQSANGHNQLYTHHDGSTVAESVGLPWRVSEHSCSVKAIAPLRVAYAVHRREGLECKSAALKQYQFALIVNGSVMLLRRDWQGISQSGQKWGNEAVMGL